jgi:hypothetical protein
MAPERRRALLQRFKIDRVRDDARRDREGANGATEPEGDGGDRRFFQKAQEAVAPHKAGCPDEEHGGSR